MKYLNKNIEEIGKRTNEKSLVNNSASCGIFQNAEMVNTTYLKEYFKNKSAS